MRTTSGLAVVTGGSSGIGLATARLLARGGMDVAIVARNPDKLARAAALIAADAPARTITHHACDLADAVATREVLTALVEARGVPDVLVNSAGVIYPGEFVSMPEDHFDINLDSGFWSVVNPCRVLAPLMAKRGSGHILNVSSVAGFLGIYGYTGYSAAKFAVMGFSEALRFEMRPAGVRVSCVCPPDTETPALEFEHTLRPHETHVIAGNIKPVPAEKVAAAIVRAVGRDTFVVIPDALSAFYFRLKGLVPEVFLAIVDGDIAKARASKTAGAEAAPEGD